MEDYKLLFATFESSTVIEAAKESHPNEMKFSGTLVQLDSPSTKAPNGSRGHKILIPKALAEKKIHTLIGMGINYSDDLEKHQPTHKVGVIQKAWIEGSAVKVSGIIWKKDFPDAEKKLKQANLGMSFEASDIDVEDQNATVWRLSNLCFTGAAILYKNSAAYYKTDALAASAMSVKLIKKINGGVNMAKEHVKTKPSVAASGTVSINDLTTALAGVMKPVVDQLNNINAGQASLRASIEEAQIAAISAKAKKAKAAAKDEDDEDMESMIDDEPVMSEAAVLAAKKAKASDDDDEDMGDDDEDMDSSADDEDELEDLDNEDSYDDDDQVGKINSDMPKNKGSKTSISVQKDKHKNVKASALTKLAAQVEELTASIYELRAENKQLRRKISAQNTQIEASSADIGRRRSVGSLELRSLLAKEGIDVNTIHASSDNKISISEFDAMLDKANLSVHQKVAIKTEAAKLGVMDEGQLIK